jgi:hypothetical protein
MYLKNKKPLKQLELSFFMEDKKAKAKANERLFI